MCPHELVEQKEDESGWSMIEHDEARDSYVNFLKEDFEVLKNKLLKIIRFYRINREKEVNAHIIMAWWSKTISKDEELDRADKFKEKIEKTEIKKDILEEFLRFLEKNPATKLKKYLVDLLVPAYISLEENEIVLKAASLVPKPAEESSIQKFRDEDWKNGLVVLAKNEARKYSRENYGQVFCYSENKISFKTITNWAMYRDKDISSVALHQLSLCESVISKLDDARAEMLKIEIKLILDTLKTEMELGKVSTIALPTQELH